MKKIRLFKPSIGVDELKNIKKVFKKSWLGYGPLVKKQDLITSILENTFL